MKSSFSMLVLVGLFFAGCSQGTPGGPGVTGSAPTYGQAENTFNLSVPMMATTVQQGESVEATVGIKRGVNFDQDVALQFSDLPKGVTVEPAAAKITKGQSETKVKFVATETSAVGSSKVKITGKPTTGGDAQVDFSLTVSVRDSFTFKLPSRVQLKQGTEETISIEIARAEKATSDVTLGFSEFPAGVTIEPTSAVIKSGEMATRFQLKATPDAALGRFDVKITGTPADGIEVQDNLQLEVLPQE